MTSEPATYPGYRFPAEIISHAIWLVLSGLVPTGLFGRPPSAQPIRVPLARTLAELPKTGSPLRGAHRRSACAFRPYLDRSTVLRIVSHRTSRDIPEGRR